jgi:class 3 adenylate cyclase/DNA-binding winged helix-turn-helix (wHTH) protein
LRYLFENYAFDTERRELHRGADVVSIAPQVFDLLDYLIRNRERVVSKDELINAIWDGRIVSDAALTTRLNVARNAIGDSGHEQRLIKTLPRKGVRFIGTVLKAEEPAGAPGSDNPARPPRPALTPPNEPSPAILPFANLGSGPEQDFFEVSTVTQTFSRFVPRRLVEQLIETGTPLHLGGTRREVTLFFSDIVDFYGIMERADPARLIQYTSRYFAAMSKEIRRQRGTVDKFIGDMIMAIWNAPADDPDHAANACAGALGFMRANGRLNAEFEREGWPAYRTRCGLHTGEAVVGNIGSEDHVNYTALGGTVNLAARLEGLNKNYGTSILVSSTVRQRAESRFVFRSVDRISPRPFAEAFEIHELRCERGDDAAKDVELCREWEVVYAALRDGPLTAAEQELAAFLAKYPEDGIALHHSKNRSEMGEGTS